MNFKISSWAIRHPIPIIVLFLLLTVLGTDESPNDFGKNH